MNTLNNDNQIKINSQTVLKLLEDACNIISVRDKIDKFTEILHLYTEETKGIKDYIDNHFTDLDLAMHKYTDSDDELIDDFYVLEELYR